MLNPENLINESIRPLYSQPDKLGKMQNRRHIRYIFKFWQKTKESGNVASWKRVLAMFRFCEPINAGNKKSLIL